MKKITILAVTVLMMAITAQAQEIGKLLDKYSNDKRFSYVSLGSGLIQLGLSFIDSELGSIGKDLKDELSKIKGLKVLTLESKTEAEKKMIVSVTDELTNAIKKDPKAELIIEARDREDITKIYTTSEGLIITSTKPGELSFTFFPGNLTKKLVQTIASEIKKSKTSIKATAN